jgi:hypothetical protein
MSEAEAVGLKERSPTDSDFSPKGFALLALEFHSCASFFYNFDRMSQRQFD